MSKKAVLIGTAVLVILAGGATAGFVLLRGTPAVQAVTDAVGLEPESIAYTGADADAALLALADLPGYSVRPSDDNPDDDGAMTPCGTKFAPRTAVAADTRRELSVSKSAFGPFLIHVTGLLPAGGDLEPYRQALGGCPTWTESNGDQYTLSEANFGTYGDETYSVRLAITTASGSFGGGIVMMRKGNLTSSLIVLQFPDVNGDDVIAVATKAAAKLPT